MIVYFHAKMQQHNNNGRANIKIDLLRETWTSSVTLKTPDVTKLDWNSGPSVYRNKTT